MTSRRSLWPEQALATQSGQRGRPVIALLETRMSRELSRLIEKHGGDPRCVPALREVPALDREDALAIIDDLIHVRHDVVIFMTGVAASLLFETAEREGRRQELLAGLQRATTVARGPKPSAALRGFGVTPTLCATDPFTSAELIDVLSNISLERQRVLLFHYGERSSTLAETLRARNVSLTERWLYRWTLPLDTTGLEQLVGSVIAGEIDALVITCQVQFRHLLHVASRVSREQALLRALRTEVVIAAIGPTCDALLRLHGVPVHVLPEQPKMGPLVRSLMFYLSQRPDNRRAGSLYAQVVPAGKPN